ncbi:hypothetical protein O9G_001264 [Rozella allomycis CSF55]|nr:hypothetical protein O9G_001264 [Rozella allomycis CSF55]|eukprot:EPZ33513.1 hypothetical protein O9G_001264 [Rozella allomycis CSF55]
MSNTHFTFPSALHFLQSEILKFESERLSWEAERTTLQNDLYHSKNMNKTLLRRIKMLEVAMKDRGIQSNNSEENQWIVKADATESHEKDLKKSNLVVNQIHTTLSTILEKYCHVKEILNESLPKQDHKNPPKKVNDDYEDKLFASLKHSNDTDESTGEWQLKSSFTSHLDSVTDCQFHSERPFLLTCSEDCTIKAWKTDELIMEKQVIEPKMTYRRHTSGITSICFNRTDKDIFFSSGLDCMIYAWQLVPNERQ